VGSLKLIQEELQIIATVIELESFGELEESGARHIVIPMNYDD